MKTITVLGSTGSIGRQTLEVATHLGYKINALTANQNAALLEEQKRRYKPQTAILGSRDGEAAICRAAEQSGADIIVTAIAGEAGLQPTLAAMRTGRRVALANKEPLVCAGSLVMQTAREHNTEIIPVDSEHSAIFQALAETRSQTNPSRQTDSNSKNTAEATANTSVKTVKRLILTASGGPFLRSSKEELKSITPGQALKHPNWDMGAKVTIDSATMMNKGLEVIEAMHLFNIEPERIEVLVHPESIIHSMVEYNDGSIIAQLSHPDMRMPIQLALTYPQRVPGLTRPLDLAGLGSLNFEKPDTQRFPCLALAYEAARHGQEACAALSRANEEAVSLFLSNKISFTEIPDIIKQALNNVIKN